MQGTEESWIFCPLVMGHLVALVAITLGYAVLDAALRARREGRHGIKTAFHHIRPSVLLWELPFAGVLVFLWLWCSRGLYSGDGEGLVLALRTIVASGVAVLPRLRVAEALERRVRRPFWHVLATVLLMAACVELARVSLEIPWNEVWRDIALQFVAIEAVIIVLAFLGLYFMFQQHGAGVALGVAAMALIGIAQYFVFLFKDANITPADLEALGTAFEVAPSYTYTITGAVAMGVALACAGMACAAYLMPPPQDLWAWRADALDEYEDEVGDGRGAGDGGLAGPPAAELPDEEDAQAGDGAPSPVRDFLDKPVTRRTALGLASFGGLAIFVTVPRYGADFGVSLNHWNSLYSTSLQGFFPCFVKEFQARRIPVPTAYNEDDALGFEEQLVSAFEDGLGQDAATSQGLARKAAVRQFERLKPAVIVIMNESFSDLSVYKAIADAGYTGPAFVKDGLEDAIFKGDAYCSIFGGGTCNSEFEALCGVNLHYLGSNKYPYTQWDFTQVACMPRQFKELGYATVAMHPNEGTNWDRNRAYDQMGFDEFYTIDDFAGAGTYHDYVSDRATYEKILEVLASEEGPVFIHDVTMQNHGPFTSGSIPHEDQTNYQPEGGSWSENRELNEYLACMNESDEAIAWLVGRLRQLDRPVALLFFGDHQPKPASPYTTLGYGGEQAIVTAERMYHTCYFTWTNYELEGGVQASSEKDEPISALGDELMYEIGAPLNNRQKASLASQADLPVLNLIGYRDRVGTWFAYDEDEGIPSPEEAENASAAVRADSLMAYVNYLEFGSIVN